MIARWVLPEGLFWDFDANDAVVKAGWSVKDADDGACVLIIPDSFGVIYTSDEFHGREDIIALVRARNEYEPNGTP